MAARSTAQYGPAMTPGGYANQERSTTSATTSSASLITISAGRQVAEMERTLRSVGDRTRYMETLTVLRRWQFDTMLDGASREKARGLVWEFEPNGWDEV
jgi:hypothetical protein